MQKNLKHKQKKTTLELTFIEQDKSSKNKTSTSEGVSASNSG